MNYYETIAAKIKKLLDEKHMSIRQLCLDLDLNVGNTTSFITRSKSGKKTIDMNTLSLIANHLNVPMTYFFESNSEKVKDITTIKYYPNIKASAGFGELNAEDEEYELYTVDKRLIALDDATSSLNDIFSIQVKGDSMEPTLYNGDYIFVLNLRNTISQFQPGLYVVEDNYSGTLVKRLNKDKHGNLIVISDNPRYETQSYTPEEADSGMIRVIGRVLSYYSKHLR